MHIVHVLPLLMMAVTSDALADNPITSGIEKSPEIWIRKYGPNGTIKLNCRHCFGWGVKDKVDPLCRYGCGFFKLYPTVQPIHAIITAGPMNIIHHIPQHDKRNLAKVAKKSKSNVHFGVFIFSGLILSVGLISAVLVYRRKKMRLSEIRSAGEEVQFV